jgi:prepilin-type N-terminal cleavage/methylation domain-containing protein
MAILRSVLAAASRSNARVVAARWLLKVKALHAYGSPQQRSDVRAFTLVELMIVVAIVGTVAVLGLPAFAKARRTAHTQKCLENQRLVFQAAQRYEMDYATTLQSVRSDGDAIRDTLLNAGYVNYRDAFECPASTVEDYDDILLLYASSDLTNTYCSMFASLHASP